MTHQDHQPLIACVVGGKETPKPVPASWNSRTRKSQSLPNKTPSDCISWTRRSQSLPNKMTIDRICCGQIGAALLLWHRDGYISTVFGAISQTIWMMPPNTVILLYFTATSRCSRTKVLLTKFIFPQAMLVIIPRYNWKDRRHSGLHLLLVTSTRTNRGELSTAFPLRKFWYTLHQSVGRLLEALHCFRLV